MRPTHRRLAATAAGLVLLPVALAGCGIGDDAKDEPPAKPARAPAEEAAARSRERVQAYLDAMTAKDVAAGRSQLCALLHDGFDLAATGPNGDFADHFQVPEAAITDIRSGPLGQEVSVSVSVSTGKRTVARPLVFTVTRQGSDWCIAGESPGGGPAANPTPTEVVPTRAS
ncbi:hypothetical protein ABZU25_23895 [Micromonospora sp. NPDC005215]|uniref:hypothetical protein n=1 Tax=Micromonospora sp. NPDC005215 TaxID=3157024 RepID=UPI0033B9E59E